MTLLEFLEKLGPTLVGIVALIFSFLINRRLIKENRELKKAEYNYNMRAADRQLIVSRLNDLYAPLQLLRRISDELHQIFKNGKSFKTLSELIDGTEFNGNDAVLLNEIICIGDQCVEIIKKNSGLIDDENLRDKYLPQLLTHYFLMKNAFEGKIRNEIDRFSDFTFPSDIDKILDRRVNELNEEMKNLTSVN
ncbi:hypothetical protein [Maribellus mangrovi]|uniref:hypothetical protein n=1 Tax=Maribellus mangrovi TaxID=3133146 RepID=UPI0030EC67C4